MTAAARSAALMLLTLATISHAVEISAGCHRAVLQVDHDMRRPGRINIVKTCSVAPSQHPVDGCEMAVLCMAALIEGVSTGSSSQAPSWHAFIKTIPSFANVHRVDLRFIFAAAP
jgi:hypothetical protein